MSTSSSVMDELCFPGEHPYLPGELSSTLAGEERQQFSQDSWTHSPLSGHTSLPLALMFGYGFFPHKGRWLLLPVWFEKPGGGGRVYGEEYTCQYRES